MTDKKVNVSIDRDASPNEIGVDIGTTESNYIPMGTVVGGVFVPDFTSLISGPQTITGAWTFSAPITAYSVQASNSFSLVGNLSNQTLRIYQGGYAYPHIGLTGDSSTNGAAHLIIDEDTTSAAVYQPGDMTVKRGLNVLNTGNSSNPAMIPAFSVQKDNYLTAQDYTHSAWIVNRAPNRTSVGAHAALEINSVERNSDRGYQEQWGVTGKSTAALIVVPESELQMYADGSALQGYNSTFGVVVSRSAGSADGGGRIYPAAKWNMGVGALLDSITPAGTAFFSGGGSTAPNAPNITFKIGGYQNTGIDTTSATFAAPAIALGNTHKLAFKDGASALGTYFALNTNTLSLYTSNGSGGSNAVMSVTANTASPTIAFPTLTGIMVANGASAATATAPGTGVLTALGNATNASGGMLTFGSNVSVHAGISEAAFRVAGLNLNATGDTAVTITMPLGATRWVLFAVRVSNSTGNLPNGTGTLGLYTGAGRTGTTLVTQQVLNAVVTSQSDGTAGNAGTTSTAVGTTQSFTATTVYFNVQTAQGATAAVDVAVVLRFF